MLARLFKGQADLLLVAGVIGILLILFAPIPTVLLDFLIVLNFSLAMTILMLTFYVRKPVEFSTFPSLLLVATLFRLSLNVAATRLILTEGAAGDVIAAVGAFVVQGNYVVGLVVFFILIVVQYVVVTSGAQRVSEVAARFTLDAVPGQQMSIDADLNMGLIDQDEAKARRKALEREASFYGAMDGASKFVKGDAVAGVIIILINIVAGWIVGMAQLGLDWSAALQQYTLLTIGDGIVTQVPALVISVAAGIIITRSSSDRQLGIEVVDQLISIPRIPLIVMAALFILVILPGMPIWPILILFALFGGVAFVSRRRGARVAEDEAADTATTEAGESRPVPAIAVLLGSALAEAWLPMKEIIAERIALLRRQHADASGVTIPPVVIKDGARTASLGYEIALFGSPVATAQVYPDKVLAIVPGDAPASLDGIEARDPAFGLPARWIDGGAEETARSMGATLVDPITVLMTHLGEVVRSEAALLVTRSDVVEMLEGVRRRQPGLIEELVPGIATVSDVQRILQNLVAENVAIRDIDMIAEILVDVGRQSKDPAEVTELVRQRLSHAICNDLRGSHAELSVLSLDPRTEALIAESLAGQNETAIGIDPRLAESLVKTAIPHVEKMIQQGLAPVLLCGPTLRRQLRAFFRRTLPRLSIVSVAEVPQAISLQSFAVIQANS